MTFEKLFEALTGNEPFPWQQKLYDEFLRSEFRQTCDVPTGLGKTSVIPIWLLALAHHAAKGPVTTFPRRLVYVVNRRTVVDQSTRETELVREALTTKRELAAVADVLRTLAAFPSEIPLAISTLRGQFADNGEWRDDPARPAVILGTVDMIGSRLLFSGYGCGFKSKPLHAGFLGQDALLVHDEAHLEPAFQELLESIESEQRRCRDFRPFRVMALTATSRKDTTDVPVFTSVDMSQLIVQKRVRAKKRIRFHSVDSDGKLPDKIVALALEHNEPGGHAILIFLRKLENVKKVVEKLRKKVSPKQVQVLTGTQRGYERDSLVKNDEVFDRFTNKTKAASLPTVFLVCTAAGEVGVNMSADHLVCDLTPFDSMVQRFGRVNRFGEGSAIIDVVHSVAIEKPERAVPTADLPEEARTEVMPVDSNLESNEHESEKKGKPVSGFDVACQRTLALLHQLPGTDGEEFLNVCPEALNALPVEDRIAAFTPPPTMLPATDILFDAWALTSIRDKLPGRPPVADWLHGVAEWEPPETYVAWREEVLHTNILRDKYDLDELLEDYPLKPHELLRDSSQRVLDELKKISTRCPDQFVWLIEPHRTGVFALSEFIDEYTRTKSSATRLRDSVVLLPPRAGGLDNTETQTGMLNGDVPYNDTLHYDISDDRLREEGASVQRCRCRDDDEPPQGMRMVRIVDMTDSTLKDQESVTSSYWRWYVRPSSAQNGFPTVADQELMMHHSVSEDFGCKLVDRLGLSDPEALAVWLAAKWHDLGKDRIVWQRFIGNADYPARVLAKSAGRAWPFELSGYRHELGSLSDVSKQPEFLNLDPEVKDLLLHLIAVHHGRARPHFTAKETIDHDRQPRETEAIAIYVVRRFSRLQRKYGRWGLAYLESLLRAADALASQWAGEPGPVTPPTQEVTHD